MHSERPELYAFLAFLSVIELMKAQKKKKKKDAKFMCSKNVQFKQSLMENSMTANSVDQDDAAHYELSHLDLFCLQIHLFSFLGAISVKSSLETPTRKLNCPYLTILLDGPKSFLPRYPLPGVNPSCGLNC